MHLRPATVEDARVLHAWRNDPVTRASSLQADPVAWDDHVAWLRAVLADADRRLYIAEDERGPLGTVRLDLDTAIPEISITVAPERRGERLAARIITAAGELHGPPVVARMKPGNEASLRAFRRCGYRVTDTVDGVLRLVWTG